MKATDLDLYEAVVSTFVYIQGVLYRRNAWGTSKQAREVKNTPCGNGYCYVRMGKRQMRYHRIVWMCVNGPIPTPDLQIDHIDGDRANNHISNLRLVTVRGNGQNRVEHRTGNLPGTGRKNGRWAAKAQVRGVDRHIGMFDTEQEAHEAYMNYIKEHNLE